MCLTCPISLFVIMGGSLADFIVYDSLDGKCSSLHAYEWPATARSLYEQEKVKMAGRPPRKTAMWLCIERKTVSSPKERSSNDRLPYIKSGVQDPRYNPVMLLAERMPGPASTGQPLYRKCTTTQGAHMLLRTLRMASKTGA